ncbi:hypothetical protein M1N20_00210 [Dehalococcoidia bacterium]|nr:hypothetical protein [Dehalococcoidia bacterium]
MVRPKVYEKYRRVARMEPLLVVEGIVQKSGGTVNILAERLMPGKNLEDPSPSLRSGSG